MAEKHAVQRDVEDFHRALDVPIGGSPAIRRPGFRASLIAEEVQETLEAITGERVWIQFSDDEEASDARDLVAAIDGMCDILCVVYGTAVEFGVDLAPFWDEVHRTNMAKQGGPVRADGKRLKPEGWQPPDIAGILAALHPDTEPAQ